MKKIPSNATRNSKVIVDTTFICFVVFSILAAKFMSYSIGILTGVFLAFITVGAHNFFHQKDSFRMYYFDFSAMSSR